MNLVSSRTWVFSHEMCSYLSWRNGAGGGAKKRTPSVGRDGGDRFIPNRSTTDMENARHSLAYSGDSFASHTDGSGDSDITDQQRIQLSQQTAELLNPNR